MRGMLIAIGLTLPPGFAGSQVVAAPAKAPAAKPAPAPNTPPPPDFPKIARGAVERSLALLQSSTATFAAKQACLSCHHQMLTAMTVSMARAYGFAVNESQAREQVGQFNGFLGQVKGLVAAAQAAGGGVGGRTADLAGRGGRAGLRVSAATGGDRPRCDGSAGPGRHLLVVTHN